MEQLHTTRDGWTARDRWDPLGIGFRRREGPAECSRWAGHTHRCAVWRTQAPPPCPPDDSSGPGSLLLSSSQRFESVRGRQLTSRDTRQSAQGGTGPPRSTATSMASSARCGFDVRASVPTGSGGDVRGAPNSRRPVALPPGSTPPERGAPSGGEPFTRERRSPSRQRTRPSTTSSASCSESSPRSSNSRPLRGSSRASAMRP